MIRLLGILLMASSALAQPPDTLWTRTFGSAGDDYFVAASLAGDGGCFLVGQAPDGGYTDAWIVRTDADGGEMWQAIVGGASWDRASSVASTTDGGCIVGGVTTSFGAGEADAWLIKVSAAGDTQWTHTYGASDFDDLESVKCAVDGGYVATGSRVQAGGHPTDMWLMKTDSVGEMEWEIMVPDSSFYAYGTDILCLPDEGFLAIGNRDTLIGDVDFTAPMAVRTDADGNILWQRYYAIVNEEWMICRMRSVERTDAGGFIMAGTWDYANHGEVLLWPDAFLLKIDEAGNPQWHSLCGVRHADTAADLAISSDGGYLTAGYYVMGGSQHALFVSRTNELGDTLWTKILPYPLGEASAILPAGNDQYLIAGSTYSYENQSWDGWLVKLDSSHSVSTRPREILNPSRFAILCYPNPFNSTVTIRYDLPNPANVEVSVFNLLGEKIAVLKRGIESAGKHSVSWQPDGGSGIYFVRMEAGGKAEMRKVVFLK